MIAPHAGAGRQRELQRQGGRGAGFADALRARTGHAGGMNIDHLFSGWLPLIADAIRGSSAVCALLGWADTVILKRRSPPAARRADRSGAVLPGCIGMLPLRNAAQGDDSNFVRSSARSSFVISPRSNAASLTSWTSRSTSPEATSLTWTRFPAQEARAGKRRRVPAGRFGVCFAFQDAFRRPRRRALPPFLLGLLACARPEPSWRV